MAVLDALLRAARSVALGWTAARYEYTESLRPLDHILHTDLVKFDQASVSTYLDQIQGLERIRDFHAGQSMLMLVDLPFVFLFLTLTAVLAGHIALVPIVMLIGYAVFALLWLPRLNAQIAASGRARTIRQRRLMDTLTGMRELRALGAEMLWLDTCREAFSNSTTGDFKTARAHTVVNSVAHGLQSVAGIAVLGLGAHAVVAGEMSVGMLIAVMTLLWRSLSPLQTLFLTYVKFDQTAQVIRQINQLMRLETEHRSARSALLIPKLHGKISVDRVSFRYGPKMDPALLGASFTIQPGELEAELAQSQQQLGERLQRLEIRAPVDGLVMGLEVNTVNQVIHSGEVLMEIVPVADRMVVRSHISPIDVGHVQIGQRAKVEVDSFDATRFGDIGGEVRQISASTFLDKAGQPYYRVEIVLDQDHVGADPQRNKLIPGMAVKASVITGGKTVMDYLMRPVYRGLGSAFQER